MPCSVRQSVNDTSGVLDAVCTGGDNLRCALLVWRPCTLRTVACSLAPPAACGWLQVLFVAKYTHLMAAWLGKQQTPVCETHRIPWVRLPSTLPALSCPCNSKSQFDR